MRVVCVSGHSCGWPLAGVGSRPPGHQARSFVSSGFCVGMSALPESTPRAPNHEETRRVSRDRSFTHMPNSGRSATSALETVRWQSATTPEWRSRVHPGALRGPAPRELVLRPPKPGARATGFDPSMRGRALLPSTEAKGSGESGAALASGPGWDRGLAPRWRWLLCRAATGGDPTPKGVPEAQPPCSTPASSRVGGG